MELLVLHKIVLGKEAPDDLMKKWNTIDNPEELIKEWDKIANKAAERKIIKAKGRGLDHFYIRVESTLQDERCSANDGRGKIKG